MLILAGHHLFSGIAAVGLFGVFVVIFAVIFGVFFVRLGDEFRHLPWVCGGIAEFVAIRMAVLCGH